MADGLGDEASRQEHRRLGEHVREKLHQAAAPGIRGPGMRAGRERKHQERIADLRHSRISDQEFQPLLPERQRAAKQDRHRTEGGEDRAGDLVRRRRQHIEPESRGHKKGCLDHQRRENGAGGGGSVGMGGGQPQMQGKRAVLASSPAVISQAATQTTASA
jgi:hypothetical protein